MKVREAKRVESDGVHITGNYGDLVLWRYFAEIGWFASIVRMVYSISRFDPGASIASLTILLSSTIEVGFVVQILSTGSRCPFSLQTLEGKTPRVLCRLLSTVSSDYFQNLEIGIEDLFKYGDPRQRQLKETMDNTCIVI